VSVVEGFFLHEAGDEEKKEEEREFVSRASLLINIKDSHTGDFSLNKKIRATR
jgi:hypothetical protein